MPKIVSFTRDEAKEDVGYGWYKLLDEIYDYFDMLKDSYGIVCYVCQVKEKFGTLRVYFEVDCSKQFGQYDIDLIDQMVWAYCDKSGSICEDCGAKGKARLVHGWNKTLCDDCYLETVKEY